MSQGCLFLDVLSVKTEICNSYNELKSKYPHVELLSCHPMFAPAAGWDGQNTVMIEITGGDKSKAFTAMVESWGSTCVSMSSGEQHDRVTAAVQNATHSALIAFGLSLKKIGYDAEMASKISTPPHRAMISIIQRMASINEPDTYWSVYIFLRVCAHHTNLQRDQLTHCFTTALLLLYYCFTTVICRGSVPARAHARINTHLHTHISYTHVSYTHTCLHALYVRTHHAHTHARTHARIRTIYIQTFTHARTHAYIHYTLQGYSNREPSRGGMLEGYGGGCRYVTLHAKLVTQVNRVNRGPRGMLEGYGGGCRYSIDLLY